MTGSRGYHILTWGCQMNEDDSEQLGALLEGLGYERRPTPEEADVVLLNTCSVRAKPEEKVYSKLGELRIAKQSRPEMVIGVCGCMAQVRSREIARRAPHVDLIVGTGQAGSLPRLLEERLASDGARPRKPSEALALPGPRERGAGALPWRGSSRAAPVRAFVPVMYGCDRFCTFCVVPLTRGRERSRPLADIVGEVQALARRGTREVTLLGQTVSSWGRTLPGDGVGFPDLLRRVAEVPGIERVRFTSPHPADFTEEVVEAIASTPEVCEHVHLPVQAGDDAVLRAMRRGYTVEAYRALVESLRRAIPGVAITTDLMVGFPGETAEQAERTLAFVAAMRFDAAFMFAYSERPGTRAARMPGAVPVEERIARLERLIDLQNAITVERNESLLGTVAEVLVEGPTPRDPRQAQGLTRTFKSVRFDGPGSLAGTLVRVRLTEAGLTGFVGELVGGASAAPGRAHGAP